MKTKTVVVVAFLVMAIAVGLMAIPEESAVAPLNPVANSEGAYNATSETWSGTYAEVMNATQDIFDLYGDIGTLMALNIGNTLSATIQLFIFSILVLMPFAIIVGVAVTAIVMIKASTRKF